MAHNIESNPDINKLKPYLALAKEYEGFFPVSTFYLKQYSVNKLMDIYKKLKSEGTDDSTIKQTLNAWIGEIEQMKQKYGSLLLDKQENLKEIESFTLNVFLKADDEERENTFTIETMKAFQACSKLFEMLNYLGVPNEEYVQKKKYAMAKAIEINKKLKNPELNQPKPKEETKIDEEFPKNDDDIPKNIKPSQEIKNNMSTINQSTKPQNYSPSRYGNDADLGQESVDRILKFVNSNQEIFEKYGFSKYQQEKSAYNINVAKNTPNYKDMKTSNITPDNSFNKNNDITPSINNNFNNKNNMDFNNNSNTNNLAVKPQNKNKEMNSIMAVNKMNMVAIRDKVQKECQSAIVDITSNRIGQAKIDLENALNLLRGLKF